MGSTASVQGHQKLKDFVTWFEIPVYDIHRATAFYNAIYNMEMETNVNGEYAMAFFPADAGIGGALVAGPGCTPSATGVLIYLNAGSDMDSVLGRVELAGGRVIMARTPITESAGSFALFIDSEGNRLALHQGARPSPAAAASKPPVKKAAASSTSAPGGPPQRKAEASRASAPGGPPVKKAGLPKATSPKATSPKKRLPKAETTKRR